MKILKYSVQWLCAARMSCLLAVLLMAAACEKDKKNENVDAYLADDPYASSERQEDQTLRITPVQAQATQVGQTIKFQARGGTGPYRWKVANNSGSLQVQAWSESIYTVLRIGPNDVIVTDQRGHAAIARVAGTVAALTAAAAPASLPADSDKAVLTASGGSPPYRWTVLDAALGHIIGSDTGESIVYMRDHRGDNVVRVRDADGSVYNVRIVQP